MTGVIDADFRWSFSKLSAYETCPLGFWLQYLQDPPLPQQQNAWAEYGILCHSLLEEFAKGELPAELLSAEYDARYDSVVQHQFPPFPKGYAEKTYKQGLAYFDSFTGFGEQYKVVSTEERFEIRIGPYIFVGVSDLVLKDKEDGKLIVIDHKTKSASSMKNEVETYKKQLYIYAEHVRQKYGEYPKTLMFNMIKSDQPIVESFNLDKHNETLRWVEETIDDILLESAWISKPNNFYCRYICSMFGDCEDGQRACTTKSKTK